MSAPEIKECSDGPICTYCNRERVHTQNPNELRIFPKDQIFAEVERNFCNNVNIKSNKNNSLANSNVDWIRTTTTGTILVGCKDHIIRKEIKYIYITPARTKRGNV